MFRSQIFNNYNWFALIFLFFLCNNFINLDSYVSIITQFKQRRVIVTYIQTFNKNVVLLLYIILMF